MLETSFRFILLFSNASDRGAEATLGLLRSHQRATLDGQHEYNFQVEGDTLVILPKDFSGEGVALSRDGQVESSFSPERFGQLMERFAIAYQ